MHNLEALADAELYTKTAKSTGDSWALCVAKTLQWTKVQKQNKLGYIYCGAAVQDLFRTVRRVGRAEYDPGYLSRDGSRRKKIGPESPSKDLIRVRLDRGESPADVAFIVTEERLLRGKGEVSAATVRRESIADGAVILSTPTTCLQPQGEDSNWREGSKDFCTQMQKQLEVGDKQTAAWKAGGMQGKLKWEYTTDAGSMPSSDAGSTPPMMTGMPGMTVNSLLWVDEVHLRCKLRPYSKQQTIYPTNEDGECCLPW